ncbi:MAG: SDR family oxidoreductase [Candidatus Eisenbacteria bacterium]|nr:SDR family oxidoreductase [Candidatus Eisenbacteria bacterium]
MEQEPKRILVTGGAVRLGRALVESFAELGYEVAIHCHRHRAEADALAARLEPTTRACVFAADLRQPMEAQELIDRVEATLGPLSALVLSAGTFEATPIGALDTERVSEAIRLNLVAPLLLATRAGQRMRERGHGSILALLDYSTERPRPEYLPYEVAKGGLETLVRGLARALAPEVRVNGLALGAVLLPEGSSIEFIERVRGASLLERLGTPGDVSEAARYLVDGAPFVTGAILRIDGGRALR